MYWERDELDELVLYPTDMSVRGFGSQIRFVAGADIEDGDIPDEIREEFVKRDFDYAPIRPYQARYQYYDVRDREIKEIDREQYVSDTGTILHCLNIFTEHPFAIIPHPDAVDYRIATPADFNTRMAKTYLYYYFAATAQSVTELIEDRYDTEDILPVYLSNRNNVKSANRWAEAREDGHKLHIAEFMNLTDLKVVTTQTEELREELGFESKTECRDAFDTVSKYRNKVMHANRTMITEQDDITKLAEALDKCTSISNKAEQARN